MSDWVERNADFSANVCLTLDVHVICTQFDGQITEIGRLVGECQLKWSLSIIKYTIL